VTPFSLEQAQDSNRGTSLLLDLEPRKNILGKRGQDLHVEKLIFSINLNKIS
jgi:hypothetical protein